VPSRSGETGSAFVSCLDYGGTAFPRKTREGDRAGLPSRSGENGSAFVSCLDYGGTAFPRKTREGWWTLAGSNC
jgi:putative hemolysin